MSRTFILHTPLGDDELQFLSLTGNETLSTVSKFEVRAVSLNPDIGATDVLGQNVTVEVITQAGNSRFIDGIVMQFTYLKPDSGASRQHIYQMTLQSWLALADRKSDSKIYQKKTIPDVIKDALQDLGLPFEFKLTGVYKPRRFLVQYQETNLNLVMRLAEEVGIYFYTKHALGQHTIVFTDGINSTLPEYDTIEYLTPGSRPMEADEYVTEWTVQHEVQSGRYVTNAYNFQAPNARMERNDVQKNNHAFDSLEIYDYHGGYPEHDDGTTIAQTRLAQHQRNFLTISGTANVRGIAPGYKFSLTDHPSAAQNVEYLIVGAKYTFQENPLSSQSQKTMWTIDFTVKPSSQRFLPALVTPKPSIVGPHSAKVTGPAGADHWCDKWGRVIVQFPWDRYGKNDENSSCWVRVSSPWAGSNYGGVHIPRVGQEVIVEFLQGNPDSPIITGRVYNDNQLPPWDLPANATQSGFLSRSTGQGSSKDNANALRFEDKKGAEEVWLQAERNMTIEVENDEVHAVLHDRSRYVGNNETIRVKNELSETVKAGALQQVGADKNTLVGKHYKIEAGDSFEVTCGQSKFYMDKDGNIGITGKVINMTASANLDLNGEPMNLNKSGGSAAVTPSPKGGGAIISDVNSQFPE